MCYAGSNLMPSPIDGSVAHCKANLIPDAGLRIQALSLDIACSWMLMPLVHIASSRMTSVMCLTENVLLQCHSSYWSEGSKASYIMSSASAAASASPPAASAAGMLPA